MTLEEALKIEIGDRLIGLWDATLYKEGDILVVVERARDYNGIELDTDAWLWNRRTKECIGGNIQHFKQETMPF